MGPGEAPGAGSAAGPGPGSRVVAGAGAALVSGPGPGVGVGPALVVELAPRVEPVQGPGTTGMAQHIGGRRVSEFKGISGSATRMEDGAGAAAPSAPSSSSSSSGRVEWGAAYQRRHAQERRMTCPECLSTRVLPIVYGRPPQLNVCHNVEYV